MPLSAPRHPFFSSGSPLAIAHRGGALEAPENSIEAFQAAAELGYRYLETDAQVTADGVVVAFHDDRVDRVTSSVGRVDQWRWEELRQLRINGEGQISTLSNLLQAFPEHYFNVDAKTDTVVEPLVSVVEKEGALDRICFGSFSAKRLRRLRALLPDNACTSLGAIPVAVQFLRTLGLPIARPAGAAAQVPAVYKSIPLITTRFVARSHAGGMAVHAWTIDDEAQMHRLLDLGVDGIMTDRPSVLKRVFSDRGIPL